MNPKTKKSKVWIGKDGILNIMISMESPSENIFDLFEEVKKALLTIGEKAKILVDASGPILGRVRTSKLRKELAKNVKEWKEKVHFEKAAIIFGEKIIRRTVGIFVIAASGLKNVKIFETKEEALKWLKGD